MPSLKKKAQTLAEYLFRLTSQFQCCKCDQVPPEYEFNIRELRVVTFLGWNGPSTMSAIAGHLGQAVSTVTGLVDRLVQKGLAMRERPEEDRRTVKVQLTDKGHELHKWDFEEHVQYCQGVLQALNAEDQETLMVLMRKILQGQGNSEVQRA